MCKKDGVLGKGYLCMNYSEEKEYPKSKALFTLYKVHVMPQWRIQDFILRGGGRGVQIFLKKCLRGEATLMLGGSGAYPPEKFMKHSAIWCVLENILLKFC